MSEQSINRRDWHRRNQKLLNAAGKTPYFASRQQQTEPWGRQLHRAYYAWKARTRQIDEELRQLREFIAAPI